MAAGRKPNKHARLASDYKKPPRELVGKKCLFVGGTKGVTTTCPVCGRTQSRGMVSRYNDEFYCSETCVLKAKGA